MNDRIQVDAGIIFESHVVRLGLRGKTVNPGWSPFVRTSSKYTVGGTEGFAGAGNQWRAGFGTPNPNVTHFDLAWTIFEETRFGFRVGNKGGLIYVYADGATAQPVDNITGESNYIYARDSANGKHICDTTIAMGAKRVVAMNQGGVYNDDNDNSTAFFNSYLTFPNGLPGPNNPGLYEEDGSYLRNCTFSGMRVRYGTDTYGLLSAGQVVRGTVPTEGIARDLLSRNLATDIDPRLAWQDFDINTVDVTGGIDSTGRYPGDGDQTVRDAALHPLRKLPTSRPIVEFPDIALATYNTPTSARYTEETVNINLRKAIPVTGLRYVVGSAFNTVE